MKTIYGIYCDNHHCNFELIEEMSFAEMQHKLTDLEGAFVQADGRSINTHISICPECKEDELDLIYDDSIIRERALQKILKPITWSSSSSLKSRQDFVLSRRKEVRVVYPFLNSKEKVLADKWFEDEKHEGLWE